MLLYFKISFLLGAITSVVIAIWVIYDSHEKETNKNFAILSILSALWSFGFYQLASSSDIESARFWRWFMESGSIILPIFWLKFVYAFLDRKHNSLIMGLAYVSGMALWILNAMDLYQIPGVFTSDMLPLFDFQFYAIGGPGYYLFFSYFGSLVLYSLALLYQELKKSTDVRASQIKYILIAAMIGFAGGGMTFLPTLGFAVVPIGVVFFSLYPIIIAYSIVKHNLFNTKVVAAELLTSFIGLLLLIRVIFSPTIEQQLINATLFVSTLIFGYTVIRSIIHDMQIRQVIEHLASQLTIANNRLEQLDKQKTEFVSIASHQLRTPLTAIKGYASMVLEGSFGTVPKRTVAPIERIFKSSQKLVMIVENFLTISRLEQGRMVYRFEPVDASVILRSVVDELRLSIEQKGIRLLTHVPKSTEHVVRGDTIKLKQVFHNLISHSLETTKEGVIDINIRTARTGKVLITISDTGRGATPHEIEHMFDRLDTIVSEGEDQPAGIGLELYISSEIIKAHRGQLWIESEGRDHGVTFFVELVSAGELR